MYNKKLLDNIKQYLEDNEILYGNTYALNSTGKESTFSEYIQAMIYSLLSARTSWNKIEKKFAEIDELFFNYNKDEILAHEYVYFYNGLTTLN